MLRVLVRAHAIDQHLFDQTIIKRRWKIWRNSSPKKVSFSFIYLFTYLFFKSQIKHLLVVSGGKSRNRSCFYCFSEMRRSISLSEQYTDDVISSHSLFGQWADQRTTRNTSNRVKWHLSIIRTILFSKMETGWKQMIFCYSVMSSSSPIHKHITFKSQFF